MTKKFYIIISTFNFINTFLITDVERAMNLKKLKEYQIKTFSGPLKNKNLSEENMFDYENNKAQEIRDFEKQKLEHDTAKVQEKAKFLRDVDFNQQIKKYDQRELSQKIINEIETEEKLDKQRQNRLDAQRAKDQKYNEKYQKTLAGQKANTQKVLDARIRDNRGELKTFKGPIPLDPDGVNQSNEYKRNQRLASEVGIGRSTNDSNAEIDELNRKVVESLEEQNLEAAKQNIKGPETTPEGEGPKGKSGFGKLGEAFEGKFSKGGRAALGALAAAGVGYGVYKGRLWYLDRYGKPVQEVADKDKKKIEEELKQQQQQQQQQQQGQGQSKNGEDWSFGKKVTVGGLAAAGLTGLGAGAYDWYNKSKEKNYKGFGDYSKKVYSRIRNQIKRIFG